MPSAKSRSGVIKADDQKSVRGKIVELAGMDKNAFVASRSLVLLEKPYRVVVLYGITGFYFALSSTCVEGGSTVRMAI